MPHATKPVLSRTLFWDVDYTVLDHDKSYRFVIERVLERGTLKEWHEIKTYYGLTKIQEAALEARYLNKKVLHFCSAIFNLPINQFECYKHQQSNPPLWPL